MSSIFVIFSIFKGLGSLFPFAISKIPFGLSIVNPFPAFGGIAIVVYCLKCGNSSCLITISQQFFSFGIVRL